MHEICNPCWYQNSLDMVQNIILVRLLYFWLQSSLALLAASMPRNTDPISVAEQPPKHYHDISHHDANSDFLSLMSRQKYPYYVADFVPPDSMTPDVEFIPTTVRPPVPGFSNGGFRPYPQLPPDVEFIPITARPLVPSFGNGGFRPYPQLPPDVEFIPTTARPLVPGFGNGGFRPYPQLPSDVEFIPTTRRPPIHGFGGGGFRPSPPLPPDVEFAHPQGTTFQPQESPFLLYMSPSAKSHQESRPQRDAAKAIHDDSDPQTPSSQVCFCFPNRNAASMKDLIAFISPTAGLSNWSIRSPKDINKVLANCLCNPYKEASVNLMEEGNNIIKRVASKFQIFLLKNDKDETEQLPDVIIDRRDEAISTPSNYPIRDDESQNNTSTTNGGSPTQSHESTPSEINVEENFLDSQLLRIENDLERVRPATKLDQLANETNLQIVNNSSSTTTTNNNNNHNNNNNNVTVVKGDQSIAPFQPSVGADEQLSRSDLEFAIKVIKSVYKQTLFQRWLLKRYKECGFLEAPLQTQGEYAFQGYSYFMPHPSVPLNEQQEFQSSPHLFGGSSDYNTVQLQMPPTYGIPYTYEYII